MRLIDTANAPIFRVDTHVWNQCAVFLVGYSTEVVIGRYHLIGFIRPGHPMKVQGVLDQALNGKETANFYFPLMTKSGARSP